jgi:hypothetical protein
MNTEELYQLCNVLKSQIESQIERQIESQIESQIKSKIECQIECQIENQIKSKIESQIESQNKEIGILRQCFNKHSMAIRNIIDYVNVLETVLIHPVKCMSPTDVEYKDSLLTFKVDNARLVEFVDIRVNEDKWVQFWSRWSKRGQPFDLDADTNTIRIKLINDTPITSLEIFTRYDKFTNSSDAGRTVVQL